MEYLDDPLSSLLLSAPFSENWGTKEPWAWNGNLLCKSQWQSGGSEVWLYSTYLFTQRGNSSYDYKHSIRIKRVKT